jgi:MFS family permease
MPARQALVPNLVERRDLTNAFSLNSIAFQFGSIAGPALGGLVIAWAGIGYVYWINAVSYAAVLVALVMMGGVAQQGEIDSSALQHARREPISAFLRSAGEGLRFVLRHAMIFPTMLLDFLATFFSSATALLPIFARTCRAWGRRVWLAGGAVHRRRRCRRRAGLLGRSPAEQILITSVPLRTGHHRLRSQSFW